jgi:hypothetical protein
MQDETERRISENGGQPLDYFLIPKSFSKFKGQKRSGEDHYVVPLVYKRLSQLNMNKHKISAENRLQTITIENERPKVTMKFMK